MKAKPDAEELPCTDAPASVASTPIRALSLALFSVDVLLLVRSFSVKRKSGRKDKKASEQSVRENVPADSVT